MMRPTHRQWLTGLAGAVLGHFALALYLMSWSEPPAQPPAVAPTGGIEIALFPDHGTTARKTPHEAPQLALRDGPPTAARALTADILQALPAEPVPHVPAPGPDMGTPVPEDAGTIPVPAALAQLPDTALPRPEMPVIARLIDAVDTAGPMPAPDAVAAVNAPAVTPAVTPAVRPVEAMPATVPAPTVATVTDTPPLARAEPSPPLLAVAASEPVAPSAPLAVPVLPNDVDSAAAPAAPVPAEAVASAQAVALEQAIPTAGSPAAPEPVRSMEPLYTADAMALAVPEVVAHTGAEVTAAAAPTAAAVPAVPAPVVATVPAGESPAAAPGERIATVAPDAEAIALALVARIPAAVPMLEPEPSADGLPGPDSALAVDTMPARAAATTEDPPLAQPDGEPLTVAAVPAPASVVATELPPEAPGANGSGGPAPAQAQGMPPLPVIQALDPGEDGAAGPGRSPPPTQADTRAPQPQVADAGPGTRNPATGRDTDPERPFRDPAHWQRRTEPEIIDSSPGTPVPGIAQRYLAALQAELDRHKHQRRGEQGTVVLVFVVDRSGFVRDHRIVHGSGQIPLDSTVEHMIRRARLPPIPAEMGVDWVRVVYPVHFGPEH